MLSYAIYTIGFFVSAFFWQYTAKRNDWIYKPTYFIDLVTEQFNTIYNWLGRFAVWISSFYTFFDFKDLIETFQELYISIKNLLFSWRTFIVSYTSYMSFYEHPYLISLGSLTLISLVLYLLYTFRNTWPIYVVSDFVSSKVNQMNEYFNSGEQVMSRPYDDECINNKRTKSPRRPRKNE